MDFPEPNAPAASRADVFLTYLGYFRARMVEKVRSLPAGEQRSSRLPSGWTPLELLNHIRHVERRWIEWRFEGHPLTDPWADERNGRWHAPGPLEELVAALEAQAEHTESVVRSTDLSARGEPGPGWQGEPATLERILFHLLQEYARHLGHLDIAVELAGSRPGE